MLLKDKIILITGGSRGIGAAIAIMCADEGASIIITYKQNNEAAKEVEKKILQKGITCLLICVDVCDEKGVKNLFSIIKDKFGRLDVLINNAGIMMNNLILMTSTEEFDQLISINCKGSFLCARGAAKIMMKQKFGCIINISSIVGRYGSRGQSVYAGTKGFIIAFTKSLAKELGLMGIRVNAIAPGFINSDLTKNVKDEIRQDILTHIPLGRIGTPDDVAKVAVFLSSDLGEYINGQIIGVDGGEIL